MNQEYVDKLKAIWEAIKLEEQRHTDAIVPIYNELHKLRCSCDHKNPDGTDAIARRYQLACPICGIDWEAASWIRKKREYAINEIIKCRERELDFIAEVAEMEIREDSIVVVGRNCEKDLRLGDKLNRMEILKIEAYGKSLDICGRGMTCRLTLKRNQGHYGDLGHFYLGRDDPCSLA